MSLPADPQRSTTGNCWFKATQQTQYVVIRSQVGWFMGHWSVKLRGSCRCLGDLCPICAAGTEPRPFYYVAVQGESGAVKFLEIPRRHRSVAEELEASDTKGIGCQLMIKKDGGYSNSPILMNICGFERCEEFDIWPFVGTLGRTILPISPQAVPDSHTTPSESLPMIPAERSAM